MAELLNENAIMCGELLNNSIEMRQCDEKELKGKAILLNKYIISCKCR